MGRIKRLVLSLIVVLSGLIVQGQVKYQASSEGDDGFSQSGIPFSAKISGTEVACAGEDVQFQVRVAGTEAYRYIWKKVSASSWSADNSKEVKISGVRLSDAGKYYCEVQDLGGKVSVNSDTIELKVFAVPTVSLTITLNGAGSVDLNNPPKIACGDSVELKVTGTNVTEYQWNTELTGQGGWAKPQRTTTYTVTGKNGSTCSASKSVTIEVVSLYVNAGNNILMSVGQSRTLAVQTNADTIFWYSKPLIASTRSARSVTPPATHPDWGTLVGSGKTLPVNPVVSTVYTAVGYLGSYAAISEVRANVKQNSYGFTGGDDDGFTQSDVSFGITPLADTIAVCQDDSVTISLAAKGISVYDYKWHRIKEGTDTPLTTGKSLTLRDCDFANIALYYCTVTDKLSGFSLNSDTTFLNVNERPRVKIERPRLDSLICSGDTIYLIANSQVADAKYSWTGNHIVEGEKESVTRVAPSVKTVYVVTADNAGCQTKDTVEIDVNVPYVDIPTSMIVGEGSEVRITALDRDGNPIDPVATATMEWRMNPNTVVDGKVNPLVVAEMNKDIEKVWVSVTFGNCQTSDTTYLRMKVGTAFKGGDDDGFTGSCIEPAILAQFGQSGIACSSDVNAPDSLLIRLVYEGTDVRFQWQKLNTQINSFEAIHDGMKITGTSRPVLKFKPLSDEHNGAYRCVLENDCSSQVISDTFTVSVKGEPVIKSGLNDRTHCRQDVDIMDLNIVATGAIPGDRISYQWYKNDLAHPIANQTQNFLKVRLSEIDNTLPNGDYVSPAGLYIVGVFNECGSVYDTAKLVMNEPAKVIGDMPDPTYACDGGSAEFEVKVSGGGTYTYELIKIKEGSIIQNPFQFEIEKIWAGFAKIKIPNITVSGKYIWRVKNECSRDKWTYSNITTLQLDQQPSFKSVPDDQDLCAGDRLRLECVPLPGPRHEFYWTKDDRVLTGQTSAILTINSVTDQDAGIYKCFVSNSCVPVSSRPIRVTVGHKPVIISGPDYNNDYCPGDTLKFKVVLGAAYPVDSVRWYYSGKPLYDDGVHIVGSNSTLLTINTLAKPDAEGTYYMAAMNKCQATYTKSVSFRLKEPARFVRNLDGVNLNMCVGNSTTLYVEATGTPAIRYIWLHDGDTVASGTTAHLELKNVSVDTSGEYVCHVQNTCGDDITKATIQVVRADTFRFKGGGHYCEGGDGLPAVLQGSDTTDLYRLYRVGNSTPIREIHGKDVIPKRGHILFENLKAGTYYVAAVNRIGCEDRMPGEVVIVEDPLPANYKLYVARHMCAGELTGDLALPGSQLGVKYYLLREKTPGWDTTNVYTGTGLPLLMEKGSGLYKIYAKDTVTGCGRSLSGIDTIKPRPYPMECELGVLNNDSVYCRNSVSDVAITYGCFEAGSSYTLWKNGRLLDPTKTSEPLQWNNMPEGVYNIRVSNRWGCEKNFGRQEIKVQELPRRYTLLGDKTYCSGDEGTQLLELEHSDKGTKYTFYSIPAGWSKDTVGSGEGIKVWVPLVDRKYYVIATDTTPEACSVPMLDTVAVEVSRLKVTPAPAIVYVPYDGQVVLNIDITGNAGVPQVKWLPENSSYLADPVTTEDPRTGKWVWGTEDIRVEVKDNVCKAEASVRVVRTGGPLLGEIRQNCTTHVDTVYACSGSDLKLCAYAEGGDGNYTYNWTDKNGPLGGNYQLTWIPKEGGFVWLNIHSGAQNVRDSVFVIQGKTPETDTIEDPYKRCVAAGESTEIVLKNSSTDVVYSLEYSATGSRYDYIDGTRKSGSGGRLTFSLSNAGVDFTGYIRVYAERRSYDTLVCSQVMDKVVEIRTAPTKYDVDGGWRYCDGTPVNGTITVDGAQAGVTYNLVKLPGTNTASYTAAAGDTKVTFTGSYTEGDYKVVANMATCVDTMNGQVVVGMDTLPPIGTLVGKGRYCEADGAVRIGITQALPGIKYYLVLDTLNGGTSETPFPVSTPGVLDFGTYTQTGRYYVKAVNETTGCIRTEGDVIIQVTPKRFALTGGGNYCNGRITDNTITVNGAENGIRYHLIQLPNREVDAKTATATDGQVVFTGKYPAGTYKVLADIGVCQDSMSNYVTITNDTLPPIGDLNNSGIHCQEDTPLEISINHAAAGVDYKLVFVSAADGTTSVIKDISPAPASGYLKFGDYSDLGRYYVTARNPYTGCENEKREVTIRQTPALQQLYAEPDSVYCEGVLGVKIGIENTENQTKYYLQKWNNDSRVWETASSEVTGDGFPKKLIPKIIEAGIYRLMSSEPCPIAMDTLSVRMIHLPKDTLKLQMDGNGCNDSTFVLRIDPAEAGVTYKLLFEGVASPVASVPTAGGTGIEWTIANAAAGKYSVEATREGRCSVFLKDVVEVDSVPMVYPLDGDKLLCKNQGGRLFIKNYQPKVRYELRNSLTDAVETTGVLVKDTVWFNGVKPGTYYLHALRGNCFTDGADYTIDALPTPDPVEMLTESCVKAGEGWLKLLALKPELEYMITSQPPLGSIRGFSGDTLFQNLPVGVYSVVVRDTVIKCESTVVTDTIREGIGVDSLKGKLYYCDGEPGVTLNLSGTELGVDYTILNKKGMVLLGPIRRPQMQFPRNIILSANVTQDTFIFRKERAGFLGGCRIDSSFIVKRVPLPADSLKVELTGGAALCAGGNFFVNILRSEKDVRYVLTKTGVSAGIDTVFGNNGGTVTFKRPLSVAGTYRIQASDTAYGCAVNLDTVLTIQPQPAPVTVDTCYYCYAYTGAPADGSCSLGLKGMYTNTIYRLNDGTGDLDTLRGPGNKSFKPLSQGNYMIIAENSSTGCIDTMRTAITAVRQPKILQVAATCGEVGAVDTIFTNEVSESGVKYYLHKDGSYKAGPKIGNGTVPAGFGIGNETGVYKIYAEREGGLCGVYMKDSVAVAPPMTCTDTLELAGSFCEGSGSGVTLKYKCSLKGWKYYVERWPDGARTDTLTGGYNLVWSQIKKATIVTGRYILKAYNQCGTLKMLDTVDVAGKPAPKKFQIVNKGAALCEGSTFQIRINGSEEGAVYTVVHNGLTKATVGPMPNDDNTVLSLGTFSAPGFYTVYAEKGGCKINMDEVNVPPGTQPKVLTLQGADICWQSIADSMKICLPSREANVEYTLKLNGLDQAVLDASKPGVLCFPNQWETGRYTVVALHSVSGCSREMNGNFVMHAPPTVFHMDNPGTDVDICRGVDTCLYLLGGEAGVNYILTRDGTVVGSPAFTNLPSVPRLKVGCVNQSGIYRVTAKVGGCETRMLDSVVVKMHELPKLSVDNELHYCEYGSAVVRVKAPTDATVEYTLYNPEGNLIESRPGEADRTAFDFVNQISVEGYYKVIAVDQTTLCETTENIHVIEDKLPLDFDLTSSHGHYLCADGEHTCIKMGLNGSETGVKYVLTRLTPREDYTEKEGTGQAFTFTKSVCDTGTYVVVAENMMTGCQNTFGHYPVMRADTVHRFNLKSVNNSYCASSPGSKGEFRLDGSQSGVVYEIYRDGVPTGIKQNGTGGPLTWTGLEGKLCSDTEDGRGYVYIIMGRGIASDCMKQMNGADTIVAEEQVEILAEALNIDPNVPICEDQPVNFNVTSAGCRENYQWYRNGIPLPGETHNYYNIAHIDPVSDPGIYYCEVSNKCSMKQTASVNLNIRPKVSVKKKMEPVTICSLTQTRLLLTSAFDDALYYVWYKEGGSESDMLSLEYYLEINNFDATKAGKYICKAWNNCNVMYDTCEVIMGQAPEITMVKNTSDTLCASPGSKFELEVRPGAGVNIEWYFNGLPTGVTTNKYTVSPVARKDEGTYSVAALNKCGDMTIPVAMLAVDDTVKLLDHSDEIMIRCKGETENLYVKTDPAKRVSYFWRGEDGKLVSSEASFMLGPLGEVSPLKYSVTFGNRCNVDRQNFVIHVPRKIEYDNPVSRIVACADCATDTVLRLNVDASFFAEYRWFYRKSEDEGASRVELIHEKADTLSIRLCSSNTGYYYCQIGNRCEPDVTTETSWVRVDSVPVVRTDLPAHDTICEGIQYKRVVTATGGGLRYLWKIQKKNGTVETKEDNLTSYESFSELKINNISYAEYDSCVITCYLENTCGKDTTESMLLRVRPFRAVEMLPPVQTICKGDTALIVVKLVTGEFPWQYGYRLPDMSSKEVLHINRQTDTLQAVQEGVYQLTYINDTTRCIRVSNLPKAEVKYFPVSKARFTGGGERCAGDTVSVHISIAGGTGPWEMVIMREDGEKAEEIAGNVDGLLHMTNRDTTITFAVNSTQTYYIYESLLDLGASGGTGCHGDICEDRVDVAVHASDLVLFRDPHFERIGMCRSINLRDSLNPSLQSGNPLTKPGFYVDGRSLNGSIWNESSLTPGRHEVVYKFKDDSGCEVSSDKIYIIVDTTPSARIILPPYHCEGGGATDFQLQCYPKISQGYTVKLNQRRYKEYPAGFRLDNRTLNIPAGQQGLFREMIDWAPGDSCITYDVMSVMDSHGCYAGIDELPKAARDSIYRDTIWLRSFAELDIRVRYPDTAQWIRTSFPINIVKGDSVWVWATLKSGIPPWTLTSKRSDWDYLENIPKQDTIFKIWNKGLYEFSAADNYCGLQSDPVNVEVSFLDTAYFRGRLWLEGPFDPGTMSMNSSISPKLQSYYGKTWPATVNGQDVIDYVTVEVRTAPSATAAAELGTNSRVMVRDTCLLLANGQLADRITGDTIVAIPNAYVTDGTPNNYYLVVAHRNHLGVMSKNKFGFKNKPVNTPLIDLTVGDNIYRKSGLLTHHMGRHNNIWLLSAGELNANNMVSILDPNLISDETGEGAQAAYYELQYDVNFDGNVDWPTWNNDIIVDWGSVESSTDTAGTGFVDWKRVKSNRRKFMEVKFR